MKEIWQAMVAFSLAIAPASACQRPELNQLLPTKPLEQPYQPPKERSIFPSPTATTLKPEETPTSWPIATSTITPQSTFTPIPEPEKKIIFTEKVKLTPEEQQMLGAVNEIRQENSLPPLEISLPLTQIARIRSLELAEKGRFSHYSPKGKLRFVVLLEENGIGYQRAGENLCRNNVSDEVTVFTCLDGLLESPGHQANLLHPLYTKIGIGYIKTEKNMHYFTLIFLKP